MKRTFAKGQNLRAKSDDLFLVILLFALVSRLLVITYTRFVAEDAYITFRFSHQIVEGNGFVHNLGEPIYGTTTPLFTLLVAGWLGFVKGDLVLGAWLLNLCAVTAGLTSLWFAMRKEGFDPVQKLVSIAMIALSVRFWMVDVNGMETSLAICFMAASLVAFSYRWFGMAGFLAGLLLWTRVDLFLWPVALIISSWLYDPNKAIRFATTTVLTYLPWVAFATLYFGSPIPHTVLAKWFGYARNVWRFDLGELRNIFQFLNPLNVPRDFAFLTWPFSAITVGTAILYSVRHTKNRFVFLLSLFAILETLRLFLTRATFFSRYLVPLLWVTLILFGLGCGIIYRRWLSSSRATRILGVVILGSVFVTGFVMGFQKIQQAREGQTVRNEASLKKIGLWLNQNTPRGASVFLEPLGYIGYFADRHMIDQVGLITPEIIQLNRQGVKEPTDIVKIFQMDYVVVHCDDVLRWRDQTQGDNTGFAMSYQLVEQFNPYNFDPLQPPQTTFTAGLSRSACYEIWERVVNQ